MEKNDCDNCLCNLHRCQAECCKLFIVGAQQGAKYEKGQIVMFQCDIPDVQEYYRLHGCGVMDNTIIVVLNNFKQIKNRLFIYGDCKYLDENLHCIHHSDGLQPQMCAFPNKEDHDLEGIYVTPNCIYKEGKQWKKKRK